MSSQSVMDSIGLGSMLSAGNLPQSWQSFTTAGMLFDYEDVTNFQRLLFIDPEVAETVSVSYEEVQTMGRTIPLFAYVNTSGRSLSLDIWLVGDVFPAVQVHRKIQWLKTFCYPRDSGDVVRPPKKMIMCLGMYLWIKGVVRKVSATHKKPFGGLATQYGFISMLPQYAVATVEIAETENFFTGGQMHYDQAVTEMNFGLQLSGVPSVVGTALNFVSGTM